MDPTIVVEIIAGIFTLAGTIITVIVTASKTRQQIEINQAIMEERVTSLKEEVAKHNNFASRMPVIEEKIKVLEHRISDVEKKG